MRRSLLLVGIALVSGCSSDTNGTPSIARECVTESSGPWTAECSAEWVATIVERAGYRITGSTGSAWVAKGCGRTFYIWATDHSKPVEQIARRESYRIVANVDETSVYGDGVRNFWSTNRYLIWTAAGPRAGSVAPAPTELAPLIRASRVVPAPQ